MSDLVGHLEDRFSHNEAHITESAISTYFGCCISKGFPNQIIFDSMAESACGAPLAQLVECRTLYSKVDGSNLARGAVLCP